MLRYRKTRVFFAVSDATGARADVGSVDWVIGGRLRVLPGRVVPRIDRESLEVCRAAVRLTQLASSTASGRSLVPDLGLASSAGVLQHDAKGLPQNRA